MEITAKLIGELKKITDAGMMDCKKALEATDGNIDKAVDWLRENGIAKAAKKAERIAAEGLCDVVISDNFAYAFELNSETDFVARNEKFLNVMKQIADICVQSKAANAEEVLSASLNGETGEQIIIAAASTIGEKISLRRVVKLEKTASQVFGVYKHNGGKIAVACILESGDEATAKDICMHIAMYNPKYLNEASIEKTDIEHESELIKSEIMNDSKNASKPADIIDKMVAGRLSKYKKEICLVDQEFIKDPSINVAQYLSSKNSKAISYIRFEVGEGMQKRNDDFAAEVAAQTKK